MQTINQIYINGEFVTPHGSELFNLYNPATEAVIGTVRLADVEDTQRAIAAAKAAFPAWSRTSVGERIAVLERMHREVVACEEELFAAIVTEYGSPVGRGRWMASYPAQTIAETIATLKAYRFESTVGIAQVVMEPVGVAGLITPWNSDAGFICGKLATAMAAGCTAVIKPSEMSGIQTDIVTRALHRAAIPAGVFNIVTGRGEVVGAEIARHPDIAKISFTGSTAVGKTLVTEGAANLKRITLELGGKSPTLLMPDVDIQSALPLILGAGFMNNGQACIAGTRILVPEQRLAEVEQALMVAAGQMKSGNPQDEDTDIGPMVSAKQWARVQSYIQLGQQEGAQLLVGGEGRPAGMDKGWFVKPTIFTRATNQMRIAREEIFGPVLTIIPYRDEAEAVAIANDTVYGLNATVLGRDRAAAVKVARQIASGRVLVNTLAHEPQAPFGGVKQSGQGREMGRWGLEAYLEPKTLIVG